jgi:hypothetical protein
MVERRSLGCRPQAAVRCNRLAEKEKAMSDSTASRETGPNPPTTIAEVLRGVEPMGDLRLAIDDLTPEDEDEFFGILEDV